MNAMVQSFCVRLDTDSSNTGVCSTNSLWYSKERCAYVSPDTDSQIRYTQNHNTLILSSLYFHSKTGY